MYLLFSRSIESDSLWPHGPQHARLPCSSSPPGVSSNSCPLTWGCHPTISSSGVAFFWCLQSVPAWESFPMGQLFPSGGQSIGDSAPSVNIQDWFPLGFDWSSAVNLKGCVVGSYFIKTLWSLFSECVFGYMWRYTSGSYTLVGNDLKVKFSFVKKGSIIFRHPWWSSG